ncbi:MAG: hypothetical protein JXR96_27480 [Deltaproteobacteria bacterium]|nr:hypothetical protein [Deltaproteobacteria bacterium]
MGSTKTDAIEAISRLPDSTDMEEIMYRLYVIGKIRKGQQSAREEPTASGEELLKEVERW